MNFKSMRKYGMGSVEGLYGKENVLLDGGKQLTGFHFLSVEEVHKLGVEKN